MIYSVSIPDTERKVVVIGTTYEHFFGIGGTGWDYITEEDADASIGLLPELLRRLVTLRNEVKKTCLEIRSQIERPRPAHVIQRLRRASANYGDQHDWCPGADRTLHRPAPPSTARPAMHWQPASSSVAPDASRGGGDRCAGPLGDTCKLAGRHADGTR